MGGFLREIDEALACEATKIQPDFSKMEQLVKDGANVNASDDDESKENILCEVIVSACDGESYEEGEPKEDSLPAVVEFFLKHGFDPAHDGGRAGAVCLFNLVYSRCLATRIPTMKILLDAGCRDIQIWKSEYNPNDESPLSCIATEASYLRCCGNGGSDLVAANICETLYEMLAARESGRPYSGIGAYTTAYGGILKRVCITKPQDGRPFFDLNEPTSRHENCFRGSLYLEFDKGWLISWEAYSLIFDTAHPHEEIVDVSGSFAPIIGARLENVEFSQKSIGVGATSFMQNIIRYNFSNWRHLTTQTNSGELPDSKSVAYYAIGEENRLKSHA